MSIGNSVSPRPRPKEWGLKDQIEEYVLTLHDVKDDTKAVYAFCLESFAKYLEKARISRFEDVKKADIGKFLSTKKSQSTRNLYLFVLKNFFGNHLENQGLVAHLHQKPGEMGNLTPSELLTPEEVIAIANEAGKKKDMYKVIILTLFESCARIAEVLALRLGDVVFGSVVDKEGKRNLIATLHFKRAKGNVKKQPVVMTMFASELKRYVENHPCKGNWQSPLFPSPYDTQEPVEYSHVVYVIWSAGDNLGIKKRVNPHWFRHSGLSYFVNKLTYNEQLLMWRAGWTNTAMAERYIHSGAELEAKAYLERMGLLVEDKQPQKILSKPCPHCQSINPYTNSNCDFCGMPLDLESI